MDEVTAEKNGHWLTVSVAVGGLLIGANSISASASEASIDSDENQSSELELSPVEEEVSDLSESEQANFDLDSLESDDRDPEYIESDDSQLPVEDVEEKPTLEPEVDQLEEEVQESNVAEDDDVNSNELDSQDTETDTNEPAELAEPSLEDQNDSDDADQASQLDSNHATETVEVDSDLDVSSNVESDDAEDSQATRRNDLVNLDQTWADGYRGEGQVVAIIDSGLYVDHRAFQSITDLDRARYRSEEELEEAKAAAGIDYGRWFNEKVIFGHNYNDVNDELLEVDYASHGTHVSDSAVGNPANPLDVGTEANPDAQLYVHGVAPEAQLMFMRVFSDLNNPGATGEYLYVQAIEDAVALGAQSINLSLGAPGGSQYNTTGVLERAIAEARRQGVSVVIAAGNENTFGYGHSNPLAENPDYGIVGSPSISRDSISVAAVDSLWLVNEVLNLTDEDGNVINLRLNVAGNGGRETLESPQYAGQEFEYEYVGLGTSQDVAGVDLTGKFALISRGQNTFTEKAENALRAGAVGAVIFNNAEDGTLINMAIDGLQGFPVIGVNNVAGQTLIENQETHRLSFTGETLQFENPNAGNLTDFTSWGLSADGELKPDLAAPGGNVYGAVNNDDYQTMSGTSMASPHVAGAVALLNQRLPDLYEGLEGEELSSLVKALLMSSARPNYNLERGAFTSPRQQGAGVMDVDNALNSGIYLTGADNYPSISLRNVGDRFEFDIKVYNISNEDKTLNITTHLSTDAVENDLLGTVFSLEPRHLKDVPEGQLFVAANSHETVKISVDAREFTRDLLADMPNGYFLEGFVSFGTDEDPLLSSIPFVGFRGDFANLDVVEQSVYEYGFEDFSDMPFYYVDFSTGFGTSDYTSLISVEDGRVITLGLDTVDGIDSDEDVTFAISPNNDGTKDLVAFRGVFLRNYEDFSASVYALNELGEEELVWVSSQSSSGVKNFFGGNPLRPKSSIVQSSIWQGQDLNGNIVSDGLYRYDLSFRSQVPGSLSQLLSFNVHVSTTRPEATGADYDEETGTLTLREVTNVYPGLNPYRTRILVGEEPDPLFLALGLVTDTREAIYLNKDGSNSFNIPDHVDLYAPTTYLHLEDYAGNSSVILLSDILHGQGGVVEFRLTDAQTGGDLTGSGLRVRIRDEAGNIVEGDRLAGLNNQNIRRLQYGSYTAEVFLMNEEYFELVTAPVQSFVVTEDNSWQTVEFLVNYIERVDVRVELNEVLPEGAAIYLVNSEGQATLVPVTSYVDTVHQVRLRAGEYTLLLDLPEGYVSEQDGQLVVIDSSNNILNVVVEREAVDKSELGALIDYARGVDTSTLSRTNQLLLGLALDTAIEVYENPEALQQDVDDAVILLQGLLEALDVLDSLAVERLEAKDYIASLDLLSDEDVAGFHERVDLAEDGETIEAVVAEADALQDQRQAEAEAAEQLAEAKAAAVEQVAALEPLSQDDKSEFIDRINAAESVEAVESIVAEAVAENEAARVEAEEQAALAQAKAEAAEVLDSLENLSEAERSDFDTRLEAAETLEAVEALVEEARQADVLALERAENERLEQLVNERLLASAKATATNVVSQLPSLAAEQVSDFNNQIETAETVEEVNDVLDAALVASNEALQEEADRLAQEEADREAAHQAELERQAQEAEEREAALQAELEEAQAEAERLAQEAADREAAHLAELERQAQEAEEREAALQAELEEARAAHQAELERQAQEAEEREAALQAELEEAQAEAERLAQEAADREAAHQAELEGQAQEAEEREAALLAELEEARAAHQAELERQAQEAEEREAALQAELEEAQAEADRLAQEAADREAEHLAELERQAQEAEEREAALQAELEAAQAEAERLAQEAADREAEHLAELERQAEEAEEREAALQAELEEAQAEAERLAQEAADREAEHLAELERQAEEAEEREAVLQAELEEAQAEAERLAQEAADRESEHLAEIERQAQEAEEREAALQAELEEAQAEAERLAQEAADRESEHLAEIERQAQEAEEREAALQAELEEAQAEAERLAQEAADREAAHQAELEQQAQEAEEREAALQAELEEARAEAERLAQEAADREAAHQAELERQAQEAEEREAAFQAELEEAQAEAERLAQEAADRESAHQAELERQAQEAEEREAALQAELEAAQAEPEEAQAEADRQAQEAEEREAALQAELEVAQAELEQQAQEAEEREAELQAELEEAQAEAERLVQEALDRESAHLAELERQAQEAEEREAALQAELEEAQAEAERLAQEAVDRESAHQAELERQAQEAEEREAVLQAELEEAQAEVERLAQEAADRESAHQAELEQQAQEAAQREAADQDNFDSSGITDLSNSDDQSDSSDLGDSSQPSSDDEDDTSVVAESEGNQEENHNNESDSKESAQKESLAAAANQATGERLPNTATSMWATALLGLSSLSTGLFVGKKKKD